MARYIKLSPHSHSGKLLHHRHTSYPGVAFLTLAAAVLVMSVTAQTMADQQYIIPGPQNDSYGVNGTVNAPPPSQAPTIRTPVSGHSPTSPITVEGSCPKDTLVKVFKNDILAGATICSQSQSYSILIDLLAGDNAIVAKAYNTLDKSSPASTTVNVSYTLAALSSPVAPGKFEPAQTPANQLLLNTETYHHGAYPGETVGWPLNIIGGKPPYAVSIGWGDNKTDLISRAADGPFTVNHIYDHVGQGYRGSATIIIKATDSQGQTAYLQTVALINDGKAKAAAPSTAASQLQIAWPLIVMLVLVIASFFLGERREKKMLEKQGLLDLENV